MLNVQTVNAYFVRSQNTRVVIRQATCQDGFCLIIDADYNTSSYFRKVLSFRNMDSKSVDTNEDAIINLRRDNKSIICLLVNIDLVNQKVIEEIEHIKSIPYVAYTKDPKIMRELKNKYPHMNIMFKTSNIALIDSLGVV